MSTMINVEDARNRVLEATRLMPVEQVALLESLNRVLAQDVLSDIDIAPFDNSAMDGFAVRYEDFAQSTPDEDDPLSLEIVGYIGAGSLYESTVLPGQTVRIMTGAPMPDGADTIVKIEIVDVIGEDSATPMGRQARFSHMPKRGDHVRSKGEEARKGSVVMRAGEIVTSAGIGLLASTGNTTVSVYRRPAVAVIATGSELVDITETPGPGMIRNSNSYALAASAVEAGATATLYPTVDDRKDLLEAALTQAVASSDFVITSGGASDGDFDFITPVVRALGTLYFNKVNMRPGKAQTFGIIDETPIFGLPGNPAAALVGFEVLIRPALRKMQGHTALSRPIVQAKLVHDVKKRESRCFYLRARLERDDAGDYQVAPARNQSSALFGALHHSNCLLILPEGLQPGIAGQIVDCVRLDQEEGTV